MFTPYAGNKQSHPQKLADNLIIMKVKVKSLSHVRLCDPMDCSLQGISIHGIFQARILEWVTISFFRGSFWPRVWTRVSCIGGRCFNLWATKKQLGFLPQEICNVIISVFSNPSSGPLFAWPGTDWDWIPQSHWLAPKGTYWICGALT